jgi:hypothetical protein
MTVSAVGYFYTNSLQCPFGRNLPGDRRGDGLREEGEDEEGPLESSSSN